jgi:hypothetical protein
LVQLALSGLAGRAGAGATVISIRAERYEFEFGWASQNPAPRSWLAAQPTSFESLLGGSAQKPERRIAALIPRRRPGG